jgi:murein DD-endopeptidase MepM/ murein hydrolase activator NlpD
MIGRMGRAARDTASSPGAAGSTGHRGWPGWLWLLAWTTVIGLGVPGCAHGPPGTVHYVRAGENLYRIGLHYGVEPEVIARENGIRDVRALRVGQRLFVPRPTGANATQRRGTGTTARPRTRSSGAGGQASPSVRRAAIDPSSPRFGWPTRGRLSSGFGLRRGRPHEGIDIASPHGSPIFAAEAGRVIHSGRMRGYGKVVVVKHAGRYRTVYAHASRLLVRSGQFVERGQKIAEVGSTGRSTGPHLHFEVRRDESPRNPLAYLP